MDYFDLAFMAIIIIQSIVFMKVLNKKTNIEESKKDISLVEDKLSESIAVSKIDNHTQMKELNVFCHELAKLQREEVLNLHTKINDLQKKLIKSGATMTEMKEDIKLIAKNPNKARKKFSQNEE
tara:strand:+ start:8086 stop:8457 length:372 start_codon:yes stop_codon:yes gene_type:complete